MVKQKHRESLENEKIIGSDLPFYITQFCFKVEKNFQCLKNGGKKLN